MCGFVGFYSPELKRIEHEPLIKKMRDKIQYRGPDDAGAWMDSNDAVAFGHRRLSIIDLSEKGRQPMVSQSGRFVLSYNGEVYNFGDLKIELEKGGKTFRGTSDTEVILESIEMWGLGVAVKRFIGMFSFSLWDRKEKSLHLVRDRLGIKPLYYGWNKKTFFFGSELKAFTPHPDFEKNINTQAIAPYLRLAYVPAPLSIYKNIFKVNQGEIVSLKIPSNSTKKIHKERYWSPLEEARAGLQDPFTGTEDEAINQLDSILLSSVKMRMISDVPLGAFLSGGIDSSLVVALMQKISTKPIRTFTIGFHESQYNEAKNAKEIAQHLGTDHTEMYVTPEEAQAVIPTLGSLYDEPFADASEIPTYLVSKLTRQHVTVSLSGDGGDELFGGYNRYFWGMRLLKLQRQIPKFMRLIQEKVITSLNPSFWDGLFTCLGPFMPDYLRKELTGQRLHRVARVINKEDPQSLYEDLISCWSDPSVVGTTPEEDFESPVFDHQWNGSMQSVEHMMVLDSMAYLPDDILTKVDRASMGVSLEARVPILDHRVYEFAWKLPLEMKIRDQKGKWILKKLLSRYVPEKLFNRPKMGFGVPIDSWLRGPLKDWAESQLDSNRIDQEGFLNSKIIRKKWEEHQKGIRDWHYPLWGILMFQQWYEGQK